MSEILSLVVASQVVSNRFIVQHDSKCDYKYENNFNIVCSIGSPGLCCVARDLISLNFPIA
jgi:hypothetical protein